MEMNKIFQGDCIEVLQTLPDNSIDLVVTDPPYGLSFMGKDWDKTLPPREAFECVIRVLKPGALAFVMSSPRQDVLWRMLSMLEGVGFELTQSYIDWIYKTGFPKAYDVSKGIDRRKGGLIDRNSLGAFIIEHRENAGLSRQDASELVTGNRTGAFWNWENNYCVPIPELWHKIKEVINAPDSEWDEKLSRSDREVIGKGESPISWGITSQIHNGGFKQDYDLTESASDLAKKWDGWKSQTGLKPAHEPILMVNKPFSESTIVDNVLKWGTGAINVDACRIPFGDNPPKEMVGQGYASLMKANVEQGFRPKDYYEEQSGFEYNPSNKGRFPANLLVSDKAIDTGKITQTDTPNRIPKLTGNRDGSVSGNFGIKSGVGSEKIYSDSGDQSRYFDLDAWAKHHGFLDVPKPDNKERSFGVKGRNMHPTVKPIKLMAYLIELGSPPDGVVLDPFMGSGTTCIAAKQLVRKYIGIEINPEYFEIAKARIAAYPNPLSWFE